MKHFFIVLLTLVFSQSILANPAPDLVPYVIFDDFETGELFGWEPYPYQQDIGYDPMFFTRRSPTYNNSRYAIARPVRANDTVELYQGFTKRMNLWTTSDTRLKAAVFFQSDRNPEKLELSLGTFDGRRYMHTIYNPEANKWVEIDVPVGAFRLNGQSLASGENIQVVTLKATYPIVYYLFNYTMLMDDFNLNGARQRRFVGVEPSSTDFEMFDMSILNKHFFYGDAIDLSVRPEGNIPLSQVRGRLVDGNGRVVRDNIQFRRDEKGNWINNAVYNLTERDARGQWEIQLTGRRDGGSDVNWGFKFIMPGNRITGHPRLYFSSEELKQRLENETSPVAKRILDRALSDTRFMDRNIDEINEGGLGIISEAWTGGPYSKTAVQRRTWRPPTYSLRDIMHDGSFMYAFTGNRAAGEKAKEALLKYCSFENWNTLWMLENQFHVYYPMGYPLQAVACAYDMLQDLLTEEEKKFVRDAVMEKFLKPFHRDKVEMNRMPSSSTNHMSVMVSGGAMAMTAFYGEDSDNPYMEPYFSGLLAKTQAFLDYTYIEGGNFMEPYGYHGHGTNNIFKLFSVLERNFGLDYSTTSNVKEFYLMPLYGTGKDYFLQGFGDYNKGSFDLSRAQRSHWFVHRLGDPYLYNYVKPAWEEGIGGYLGYLWYRDDITPIERNTLPTSRVFSKRGMIMRSGWDDESVVITIQSGPNANHYHYDQGSFQIQMNGEELLADTGTGPGGYYGNLEFTVYNIHAIAHNVMLIDHDPESQWPAHYYNGITALSDWPRALHSFAGEITDAFETDLACVYKDKLDNYTRTFLYTKSGPLFLYDRVKSKSSDGHIYNWLFHALLDPDGQRSIAYRDNRVTINRPNARMTIDIVSDIVSGTIQDSKSFDSFVTLSSRPNLTETSFLAVLMPEALPASGSYGPLPVTTGINESGWMGAKVERGGLIDYAYFRESMSAGNIGGFTTDASRFTAAFNSGNIYKAYFEGSRLSGNGLEIRGDSKITCALEFKETGMDIEVKSEQPLTLTIAYDSRPSSVTINNAQVRNWQYDNRTGTLSIRGIPAGRNDINVR